MSDVRTTGKKSSNTLVRDLVNVGIFSALYIVLGFMSSSIGYIPALIVFSTASIALVTSVPMFLFYSKIERPILCCMLFCGIFGGAMIVVLPAVLLVLEKRWRFSLLFSFLYAISAFSFDYLKTMDVGLAGTLFVSTMMLVSHVMPISVIFYYVMTTTKVNGFMAGMSKMHIPNKVTIPLAVMIRFFPTVFDEARDIGNAMRMPAKLESKGPEYAASLGLRCMNLEQLKNKVPELAEGPESSKEPAKRTLKESLVFKDLHFAYNRKFPVLDIPELSLPRNQITAVIGHNGAGKSTLAQVLCGLRGTWRQKRKARKYGAYLIMQDVNHQLFTESVLDEVLLGMNSQDKNAALEILERLNLKDYASSHPMALSGGQKQRVVIGSGVSSGREIVVFDEPTSGLDYKQMLAVSATLQKLAASGKTLLVITHDPEFILNCCQSVIRMEHGKIVEQYLLQGNQEKLIESMIERPWNAF